ncbi:GNAT family N-acetyltransferase [Candidatus Dojkabacteria bacterium]|nr:GNAT family N-acetyltransferase [Candidatus Dojkabacteria bacterium]
MALTISDIANNPPLLRYEIPLNNSKVAIFRPLEQGDTEVLSTFLESLSPTTQRYYTLDSFDLVTAQQMCNDINKYDKVRFITIVDDEVLALVEFSMDLVQKDIDRFKGYNIKLKQGEDCRFGPCVSDNHQGTGLGSKIFPYIVKVAKEMGQKRVILWGGVFADNEKAIKYYIRNGFKELGRFKYDENYDCIDMILEL